MRLNDLVILNGGFPDVVGCGTGRDDSAQLPRIFPSGVEPSVELSSLPRVWLEPAKSFSRREYDMATGSGAVVAFMCAVGLV